MSDKAMKIRLQQLMDRFMEGTLTDVEAEELSIWYEQHAEVNFFDDFPDIDRESLRHIMMENVMHGAGIRQPTRAPWMRRMFPIIAAAAAAVIVMMTVYWRDYASNKRNTIASETILPANEDATLQLSDGQLLDLATMATGDSTIDEGIAIYKNQNGEIEYKVVSDRAHLGVNVVRSPLGSVVRVVLPDGSRVVLNARSELRYSLNMMQDSVRYIQLSGEAHFTVKHTDNDKPFVVQSAGQEVFVLGTVFNVEAYAGSEPIKTSLQEGRVELKINQVKGRIPLRPGQQLVLERQKHDYVIKPFSAETELDWVDGNFIFQGDELFGVLKRIADWYDLELDVPHKKVKQYTVYGVISRKKPLSDILSVLEQSVGLRFGVEEEPSGKKLLVLL
ncbi:FecR family protein [Sphingobacterium gobiense]|uniref:Anti-sigma factor n=1 Tax=Sphingobacterium gobiense TaxID=1382456 RepID=A0A2S9JGD2_9SPHI|nr:FecR family protein [Sphingobacterium gobiense]PRD52003.1 hypothetical protein C5749_17040 [Sphingobacterium gobiense]